MNKMIRNILTDAVEGPAIAYWAAGGDINRDVDGIVSFQVMDAGPDGSPVKEGMFLIDEAAIMAAREKIINTDVDLNRDTAAQFVGPVDKWEYDQDGIDALIQVAVFGKIVYG